MANEVYRKGRIVLELPTLLFWLLFLAALLGLRLPVFASELLMERIDPSRGWALYLVRSLGAAGTMLLMGPVIIVLNVLVTRKQPEPSRARISPNLLVLLTIAAAFAYTALRLLLARLF